MQPRTGNRGIFAVIFAALLVQNTPAEDPAPDVSLFVLPTVELRSAAAVESAGSAPAVEASKAEASDQVEELSISSEKSTSSELSIQNYEAMSGTPILSRIEMREPPGGALGWLETEVWDPVFAPEVVKVGKVEMSGGIVAAIKRKNPFCLLHPLVFVASW